MTTSGKEDIKTDDKFIIDFEAFEKSELSIMRDSFFANLAKILE